MSEASGGGGRAETERRIVHRSIEDDAFRQRLIEDPKADMEQEFGTQLPEEVRVVAVEETPDTIYLVLPSTSMAGGGGVELSDQQLESVAGGEVHLSQAPIPQGPSQQRSGSYRLFGMVASLS